MANQIDVLADWATSPAAAGNFVVKPSAAKRAAGWTGGATPDVPPAPHINWLHNTAYQNIGWLIDNLYYGDMVNSEYVPVSGSPSPPWPVTGGTYRFSIGNNNAAISQRVAGAHFAYDGLSAFCAVGSIRNNTGGAATGFAFISTNGGRSYDFKGNTGLSAFAAAAVCYDPFNARFVVGGVASVGTGPVHLRYTSDYGANWSHSTFVPSVSFTTMYHLIYHPQTGRYISIAGGSSQQHYCFSASGSITGSATALAMTSGDQTTPGGLAYNSKYTLWIATPSAGSNAALYMVAPGPTMPTLLTSLRVLCNTTPLNMPNQALQSIFYTPHNDTFVIASTGSFITINGQDINPTIHSHWASVTAVDYPTGNGYIDWLYYDQKRTLYYMHRSGAGMYVAPALTGPWNLLPGVRAAANATVFDLIGMYKVLSASYLDEYFVGFDAQQELIGVAPDSSLLTNARRTFPLPY